MENNNIQIKLWNPNCNLRRNCSIKRRIYNFHFSLLLIQRVNFLKLNTIDKVILHKVFPFPSTFIIPIHPCSRIVIVQNSNQTEKKFNHSNHWTFPSSGFRIQNWTEPNRTGVRRTKEIEKVSFSIAKWKIEWKFLKN